MRLAALVSVLALVGAACGGSKKSSSATATSTTSTSELATTTSTTAAGAVDATTTTAVTVKGATTTTAKASSGTKTTATTAKSSTGANKPSNGITNVTSAPSTAPAADVQPGGTITFLRGADSASFDPILLTAASGADGPSSFAEYGALVYSDPADGIVKPQMADSLTSTDALVWTLHLRAGIRFSDSTVYDAAAVKFNWLRLQDPNNHASRAVQANLIASMEVVDPLTLKLTLKAKNAVFPQSVALIPYVGSPAAIQAKGSNFGNDPVGAGPFVLKNWARDSQMTFVRNPTYWDAPRPYVDQLIMKPVSDESQRANTLIAGQGNMMITVVPQTADQLNKAGGQVEYQGVQNGGPNVYFNMRIAPFSDIRARKAVTEAIDRADLVKTIFNNSIEVEDSLFRHNSPYYDPTIVQLPYNPTDAQTLFDQLAADTGGPLKFTMTSFGTGNFPAEAQYIQAKLNSYKNVNVALTIEAVNLHIANELSGNFTGMIYSNPFDDPEPTWTSVFVCPASNPQSPTGWCNAKFDADIADNQLTLNAAQRVADLKDAQKQFYTDLPGFYYERRVTFNYTAQSVKDFQFIGDGTPLFDRLWIKSH